MRRIALAAVLAATMAPAAHATHDRNDAIPTSVGPSDARSYRLNLSNLPAGVSADRLTNIVTRTLQRWGATYAGTTTASPDDHRDRLNVIGFSLSSELDADTVGLNTKSKGGILVTPGGGETCAAAPNMGTTQTVTPVPTTIRLRLRSDRVRKKKLRKRTITTTRTLTTPRVDSTPVSGQRCLGVQPGTESDPASVYNESDVQLRESGVQWFAGPGEPPNNKIDLESVLIHELGHAAGLAHQPQNCDPSSPMRPSSGGGDFWRGLEPAEYRYADCANYQVTPDPAHAAETAFAGGSLGGRAIHVNPAVPNGYDSARFVAVAQNVIARWGGTYAGLTDAKPAQGDGLSVIGFDAIARTQFELTRRTTTERLVFPPFRTCTLVNGSIPSFSVKKVTRKVRVRVRGRRRVLKVRRDRVVQRSVSGPATGQCTDHPAESRSDAPVVESDIGIAHEIDAYELSPLGPVHPVLLTKVDMATLLASALGQAAGIAPAACGSTATPVTTVVQPGDWWHAPSDVHRVPCPPPSRAASRTEPQSGPVHFVRVQE